ncbi:hypothetical protein DL764_005973 [Monosporascus ibericus]|uniref:Proteasome maturation factor UMP1 n=1 Tax=Monosporascus ibericus TaxID=155417 RepID=A0A4Q4T8Q8_9PEZI|nr:hypothetical protein DL764_005973 [Monosporascus ibericus]
MSMRIVPAAGHSSTFAHTQRTTSAPSAPGVYDTLRQGLGPSPSNLPDDVPASRHPLEARLKAWEATQEGARMEMLRKTFGMAEPIRRGMELKVTREGSWRPLALGGLKSSLHEDVLRGREAYLDWEDVFTGEEQRGIVGIHDEMERKLKI